MIQLAFKKIYKGLNLCFSTQPNMSSYGAFPRGRAPKLGKKQTKLVRKRPVKRRPASLGVRRRVKPRFNRGRFMVRTRRRRMTDPDSSQLFTRLTRKYGRYRRPTVRRLNRRVTSLEDKSIYFWRHLSPFSSNGGSIYLVNWESSAPPANDTISRYYPVHCYDLTSIPNYVNGVVSNYSPGLPMMSSAIAPGLTARTRWDKALAGQSVTGTPQSTWAIEYSTGGGSTLDQLPGKSSHQKWVDIKMMCHGAVNFPVKYSIQIVQFRNQCHPRFERIPDVPNTVVNYDEFWHYMARPYTYSPHATELSNLKRNMRVLKNISFILQPRDSSFNGTVVPFKEVKIFWKCDKTNRYNWEEGADNAPGGILDNDYAGTATVAQKNSNTVKPELRTFLIVRATAAPIVSLTVPQLWNGDSGDAVNFNTTPSYDISIRTKHHYNE